MFDNIINEAKKKYQDLINKNNPKETVSKPTKESGKDTKLIGEYKNFYHFIQNEGHTPELLVNYLLNGRQIDIMEEPLKSASLDIIKMYTKTITDVLNIKTGSKDFNKIKNLLKPENKDTMANFLPDLRVGLNLDLDNYTKSKKQIERLSTLEIESLELSMKVDSAILKINEDFTKSYYSRESVIEEVESVQQPKLKDNQDIIKTKIEKVESPESIRARKLYSYFTILIKDRKYSSDSESLMKELTRYAGGVSGGTKDVGKAINQTLIQFGKNDLSQVGSISLSFKSMGDALKNTLKKFGKNKPAEIRTFDSNDAISFFEALAGNLQLLETNSTSDKLLKDENIKALKEKFDGGNGKKTESLEQFQIKKLKIDPVTNTLTENRSTKNSITRPSDVIKSVSLGYKIDKKLESPKYDNYDYEKELATKEEKSIKQGAKYLTQGSNRPNLDPNKKSFNDLAKKGVQELKYAPKLDYFEPNNFLQFCNIKTDSDYSSLYKSEEYGQLERLLNQYKRDLISLGRQNSPQNQEFANKTLNAIQSITKTVLELNGIISILKPNIPYVEMVPKIITAYHGLSVQQTMRDNITPKFKNFLEAYDNQTIINSNNEMEKYKLTTQILNELERGNEAFAVDLPKANNEINSILKSNIPFDTMASEIITAYQGSSIANTMKDLMTPLLINFLNRDDTKKIINEGKVAEIDKLTKTILEQLKLGDEAFKFEDAWKMMSKFQ